MRIIAVSFAALAIAANALAGPIEAPWDKYRAEVKPPAVPADNPWTEAGFQLGRRLFYDPVLSVDGATSCSSCHIQNLAFSDGRRVSPGAVGKFTDRNSQGLVNAAWHTTLTWARPNLSLLEKQFEIPLYGTDPIEMGLGDHNIAPVLEKLRRDPQYAVGFQQVFGSSHDATADAVTMDHVMKALATFVRGIVSAESRFDRHQRGELALTPAETRGKELFFGEQARCHNCHGGFNFNDQMTFAGEAATAAPLFHNTGQYNIDGLGAYPERNRGVFESTKRAADMGAFRAPGLRNVAITQPYMHDGSVPTLAQVIQNYAAGGRLTEIGRRAGDGRKSPLRSPLLAGITLSEQQQADLLAFLGTLTDEELRHSPRFAKPADQP